MLDFYHSCSKGRGNGLDYPPASTTRYYKIQAGDSLSKIAKEFYGDANRYSDIFEANKEVIKDPDLIYPRHQICIP